MCMYKEAWKRGYMYMYIGLVSFPDQPALAEVSLVAEYDFF